MIMDYNAQFSDAQSAVTTASISSTNVLDTEVADSNVGSGTPIWVICRVNTAFTGSGLITIALQDCATSGGTYVSRLATATLSLLETDAVGDDLLVVPLPSEHQRYLKLLYTNTHGSAATGAVDAYLCLNDPHALKTK